VNGASLSEFDPTSPDQTSESVPEPLANLPVEVAAEPAIITTPPKPSLRSFFFGDDGLRAGWSVLLYILLVVITGVCTTFLIRHFHLIPKSAPAVSQSSALRPRSMAINEAISFFIFAFPAVLMSLIERRPFGRYGLPAARMIPDFLTGLFWGFASLSALVGLLYVVHGIAFDGVLLHGTVALLYAAKWGLVFLFVGLSEEFLFRGFLVSTVSRGVAGITRSMDPNNRRSHAIGFWVSAGIFSIILFMVAHLGNGGENFVGIFQVGLVGAVFAFSLYRTGSLWWAVGTHAAWDWAQSYFYGTADSGNISLGRLMASHPVGSRLLSGGSDGPEGSVLGIPILLLLAVVIHFTLPRRNYFLTPDQSAPIEPPPAPPAEVTAPVL